MDIPQRLPSGVTEINVRTGDNLFRIAEEQLGDATQWWRIAVLNAFPGVAPDFIVQTAGKLKIPARNLNVTK